MARRPAIALAGAVLALLVAGCGSGSGNPAPNGPRSDGGTASGRLPGAGKPSVRLGTKDFTEQYILGELYAQALRARGFRVTLRRDIGPSEVVDRALTGGRIDGYPEYTGTILSTVAHQDQRPRSAREAYDRAAAFERTRGMALLDLSSAEDKNVIATTPAYARARDLRSLADLPRLDGRATVGGPAEFRTRFNGLVGLRRVYGVRTLRFRPLTIGSQYRALARGAVPLAAVFTTDGQLSEGGYTLLKDPADVFGFQNVTFVIRRQVLASQGPEFARVINAVTARLSTQALRVMNASVDLDRQAPRTVAAQFLRANGLI